MSLLSIIVFILILGVLVAFHEFGHLLFAKAAGMRVEEFAFGFGPRLVRLFKRRETEYTIHAVPLGGFVKIAGMEPGEEDIADGFQAKSVWKRALVISAGPLFSFILGAGVLLALGFFWGFQDHTQPQPIVGSVEPKSEAARIGLRAGDRVLEINGTKITKGTQMTDLIHRRPGQWITVLIKRDGREMHKTAKPRWVVDYLGTSWSFLKTEQATVGAVDRKSAAGRAGIREGDKLVAINGKDIDTGADMVKAIRQAGKHQTSFTLDRNGQEVTVKARPTVQWVEFAGVKWSFPHGYALEIPGMKPADGIRAFDLLLSVNGTKIGSGEAMLRVLDTAGAKPLQIVVKRDDKKTTLRLTPEQAQTAAVSSGSYTATGILGFLPAPKLVKTGRIRDSLEQGFGLIGRIIQLLITAITTERIKTDVGGPIMIAKVTASQVALGPYWVLWLLGGLSLSLAVINLIPLPAILDGGHLILLLIEWIRRKRWTREQMQAMQMVGVAVIAVLIVVLLVSDITKIATGMVPQ